MNQFRTIYFAGALFSNKDLIGNSLLADAIHSVSESRYRCILPQNREQRDTTSKAIRNQDLYLCASCDLGLFHFDGSELDSGTVVEYMFAKFLDIPSVLVRSDFRKSGDDQDYPWNLMLSNFPRTKVVSVDAMAEYQKFFQKGGTNQDDLVNCAKAGVQASLDFSSAFAVKIVESFDQVCNEKAVMPSSLLPSIYEWVRLLAGAEFSELLDSAAVKKLIERRIELESP